MTTEIFIPRHESDIVCPGFEIVDIEATISEGSPATYFYPGDPSEIFVVEGYVALDYDDDGNPSETRPLTEEEREDLAFDDANFCEAVEVAASNAYCEARDRYFDRYDECPIY